MNSHRRDLTGIGRWLAPPGNGIAARWRRWSTPGGTPSVCLSHEDVSRSPVQASPRQRAL